MKYLALIAAGGTKTIQGELKPFVEIGKNANIDHVVRAALGSKYIDDVVVWGNEGRLAATLADKLTDDRVVLRPERKTLVESITDGLIEHLKRGYGLEIDPWEKWENIDWNTLSGFIAARPELNDVRFVLLPSDTPLITPGEIDDLIDQCPDADLAMGFTYADALRKVLQGVELATEEPFDYKESRMNFFKFNVEGDIVEARLNNFYMGKISMLDRDLFDLFQSIFVNRGLVSREPPYIHPLRLARMRRAFIDYVEGRVIVEEKGQERMMKRYKSAVLGSALRILSSVKRDRSAVSANPYLSLRSLEDNIRNLTGKRMVAYLSNAVGLLVDTDTDYEASFINDHWDVLREVIGSYRGKRKITGIIS